MLRPQNGAERHPGASPVEAVEEAVSAEHDGEYRGQGTDVGPHVPTPWTVRPGTPIDDPADAADQDAYPAPESAPRPGRAERRSRVRGRMRRRRSRNRAIVSATVLAVLAAGTATWLVARDGGASNADVSPATGPGGDLNRPTFRPAPTVPPPPGATAVLADPGLDTGPFTAEALFPQPQISVDGRTYTVVARHLGNTCADAGSPALGGVLRARGCIQIVRITATSADGTAATVAVASFGSPADAKAAATDAAAHPEAALLALPGTVVPVLCPPPAPDRPGVVCARQSNVLGRYGVFLVGGYPGPDNRIDPAKGDPLVDRIGNDLDRAARDALTARAEQRSQAIYEAGKAAAEKAIQGG